MASLTVQPRPTPEERPNDPVEVEVDEALTVLVTTIEDFVSPWAMTTSTRGSDVNASMTGPGSSDATRRSMSPMVSHIRRRDPA